MFGSPMVQRIVPTEKEEQQKFMMLAIKQEAEQKVVGMQGIQGLKHSYNSSRKNN